MDIIEGTSAKSVSSDRLKQVLAPNLTEKELLYLGFPVIGTPQGSFPIDALLVSPTRGVVIFNLIENQNSENYQDLQDEAVNKFEAKLRNHKSLMDRRALSVKVNIVTFAPVLNDAQIQNLSTDPAYPIANENNILDVLSAFQWNNTSEELYKALISVIQSISNIRQGKKKRDIKIENSRGDKLRKLEDSIANLDNRQGKAVIESVKGIHRIRGLAGSGKTIVLALKAAYLHAQHPEWKIAVTFNTRSLKNQFRQLINTFTIEQTNEEPNWENLEILQAWGAPNSNGLYYTFCKAHNLDYLDYQSAKIRFEYGEELAGVCKDALSKAALSALSVEVYDAILIDEAQDFSPDFLRLAYALLKSPKRLVYAYDELQNLNAQSMPSPKEIFGVDEAKDTILEKCYRNSRPVLATAHALGFGIYREPDLSTGTGLVQIFDQDSLWEEIGYMVEEGELVANTRVLLKRTNESSPEFLEEHSPIEDILVFRKFDTLEQQDAYVVECILKDLRESELRADDIVVINPNPLTTQKRVGNIRKLLFDQGIQSHLAGVDTSPDTFFRHDASSITFTGIHRAKGNEAGMIYIINADECIAPTRNLATNRNRLFTAITRSKAWIRVFGVGNSMDSLIGEFSKVQEHDFKLDFVYPSPEIKQKINIINRDMTETEKNTVNKTKKHLKELLKGLKEGTIYLEDFDDELIGELRSTILEQE